MLRKSVKLAVMVLLFVTATTMAAKAKTFDVTKYGAQADGVTDAADAIQKAIDAAAKAGGGVVVLPKNEKPYLVSRTIKITSSNIELSAYGAAIKLADGAANNNPEKNSGTENQMHVIYVTGTKEKSIKNIKIMGLLIDGNIYKQNSRKYYNPRAIVLEYTEKALIKDVKIIRAFVVMDFGVGCNDCEARDCIIEDFTEDGYDSSGDANYQSGSTNNNIRFINCHARNAPNSGGNAWEIEDGTHNVLVKDCSVTNVGGNAFGIRNHWQKDVIDLTDNIELNNVTISNISGKYGVYSHSAPPDRLPTNKLSNLRLINVKTDKQVLFYGPLKGLKIIGGKYSEVYLGYQYGKKGVSEVGPPMACADVDISDAVIEYLQINGKSKKVVLNKVTINAKDKIGIKVEGGAKNIDLSNSTVNGGILLTDGASPKLPK